MARPLLGTALVAAYLHGSAVTTALRPDSDVDVMFVVDAPLADLVRRTMVRRLREISGQPGSGDGKRPIELVVFHRKDLAIYPARCVFVYGEWLPRRTQPEAGAGPSAHPEFTLLLAQARHTAKALAGPSAEQVLPAVPDAVVRRAIGDALPDLVGSLDGDERNVLLTLARMWHTLESGAFVSKDAAARWAAERLPDDAATLIASAGAAYLGVKDVDWRARQADARRAAGLLRNKVEGALQDEAVVLSRPASPPA